ncbi:MAG TPA: hypothetical protein VGF26_18490 [Ramlibacter sp.]
MTPFGLMRPAHDPMHTSHGLPDERCLRTRSRHLYHLIKSSRCIHGVAATPSDPPTPTPMTFLAVRPQPASRKQRGIAVLPVAGVPFMGVEPALRPRGPAPPRR